MRPNRVVLAAVALFLLGTGAPLPAQETAEDLYQAALYEEDVEGNLDRAIAIYERIVAEHPQERSVAARALMRIGLCHEKLGSQGARRAYSRLLRDYADQREAATGARARLNALLAMETDRTEATGGPAGLVLRQIGFDGLEASPFAKLSPDGGTMAYMHLLQDGGSFRARDLSSGEEVVLVDDFAPYHFEWSTDGSQLAFGRENSLAVVPRTGGEPRVVWSSPSEEATVVPLDWAPDDRVILVAVREMTSWTHQLLMVPLQGGAPRPLVSGGVYEVMDFGQFSPDGSHVAGMRTVEDNTEVYVWSVGGNEEVRVTTHTARDEGPFWSPDGRFLVFCSDRTGQYEVWAVPMREGAPDGPPVRVKAALGAKYRPSGMTDRGQLTFLSFGEGTPHDLFVMELDSSSAMDGAGFESLTRYPTQHFQPRWSPDGERFAYTSRKGEIGWPRIFVGAGSGRLDVELPMRDHYPTNVEWGRDGNHLVFPGFTRADGRAGIFRLSLEDNTFSPIHVGDPLGPGFQGAFVNLRWLPLAGKFFLQQVTDSSGMALYTMDESEAVLEKVTDRVPTNSWTWPSPDGRHVAYRDDRSLSVISLDDGTIRLLSEWQDTTWFDVAPGWSPDGSQVAWTDRIELAVLDVEAETRRTLLAAPQGSTIVAPPTWSPGGGHIAYVLRATTDDRDDEVWLVPSTGGSPRRIGVTPPTHPLLHLETWLSDGMLAATGLQRGPTFGGYQYWILEGFLPLAG